jgi:hypothetical protein
VGFIFIPFLIGGVALIVWHRRIADASLAANRAFAASLGFGWMQRLIERPWIASLNRITTILVGLIWMAIAIIALVATLTG